LQQFRLFTPSNDLYKFTELQISVLSAKATAALFSALSLILFLC